MTPEEAAETIASWDHTNDFPEKYWPTVKRWQRETFLRAVKWAQKKETKSLETKSLLFQLGGLLFARLCPEKVMDPDLISDSVDRILDDTFTAK